MMGIGGDIERWAGGATAHGALIIGQLGPAAQAQREEFKKAKMRARIGNYGYSQGQMDKAKESGQASIQAQQGQQLSDIQRALAAGTLSGGAATAAQTAVANAAAAGAAQVAGQAQQQSDVWAQQQHAQDQARIDAQAAQWRDFNQKQADVSLSATNNSGTTGGSSEDWETLFMSKEERAKKKAPPAGGASASTATPVG